MNAESDIREMDGRAMEEIDNTVEKDGLDHDQENVYRVKVRDIGWIDILPGSMELTFDNNDAFTGGVIFTVQPVVGEPFSGLLGDIIGLRSFDAQPERSYAEEIEATDAD